MILYFTTRRATLTEEGHLLDCPFHVCRMAGFTYPHLCFATAPLSGKGENVFTIDIPQAEIAQYEYQNEFRPATIRFFALPHALVQRYPITMGRYEEYVVTPWNQWVVPVLDRRADPATRLLGRWAVIWMSREGVATAKVFRRAGEQRQLTYLSVEVQTTQYFDPEQDYIVVEHHKEQQRQEGSVKQTWELETLAGVTPEWAIFPTAWANWAWDKQITQSAVEYILRHVPQVTREVEEAQRTESKGETAWAWRQVADKIGRLLRIDLGKLAGHSWTAVQAMPTRIASRLSGHVAGPPWVPPRPKPEYSDPDQSGRVVLANPYGPFPTRGPGVDYAPADRPLGRLEDNEDPSTHPFSLPQSYARSLG